MAIKLKIDGSREPWFCDSKWLGDPDMPGTWEYPMIEAKEDGEVFDYPLTFVCQINCEDLAPVDPDGRLPHEGMLYFWAALEEYRGYESPVHVSPGELPHALYMVKYSKSINMETFETNTIADEDDQPFSAPAKALTFEQCPDDEPCTRLLGDGVDGLSGLLNIVSGKDWGFTFLDGASMKFAMPQSDLEHGNWKRTKAVLK